MTKVSIITSIYNSTYEMYERSLDSINAQTSKDFEWIVVDDGSERIPENIFDVRLDKNYGPSVARNVGFQISSGDIITYLDIGDELAPNRVENIINLFESNKCEMLFSAYYMVEHEQPFIFDPLQYIGTSKFPTAFDFLRVLNKDNISIPLGVAHTRRPFVLSGGFQRGIVCGEDGILWRRMVGKMDLNKILFSDDVAGTYYISENGQSRTQRRFEMGGFAFDGDQKDNGKYLDREWFETFSSKGLYD
jgi:glycosyltransferase involved in cell wall biosynthesis